MSDAWVARCKYNSDLGRDQVVKLLTAVPVYQEAHDDKLRQTIMSLKQQYDALELQCCQPTTAAVVCFFSSLSALLRMDRQFQAENVDNYYNIMFLRNKWLFIVNYSTFFKSRFFNVTNCRNL